MNIADIFQELGALPRWVPYQLVWNPKREKFDKIPYNGSRKLSTKAPTDWLTLVEAAGKAQEQGLPGVGLVLTGAIKVAGWQLVGFDFDDVDFEHFQLPFAGYAETSPSGTGVRSFAWVPEVWAMQYRDTVDAIYPDCAHAEIYLGTSARFLTTTFDALSSASIPYLKDDDLLPLASRLKPAETPARPLSMMAEAPGKVLDLDKYSLTPEQKEVVIGQGKHDRSAVIHGLIIKLLDEGASREDVFATLLHCHTTRDYFMSHRHNDEQRAMDFARSEIEKGYRKSKPGLRERLAVFNDGWVSGKTDKIEPRVVDEELVFPMDIYDNAPGLVGEIARWVMGASYSPREQFAYSAALVMVACLAGPYCTVGSRDGKLNLYLTLVGNTGTGKNDAIDMMAKLMTYTDAKDYVTDFPASESALRRQLNNTPNVMLRVDELAHKLESMENNANGSGLGRAILEAYNGARMPPKNYAENRRDLPAVENPFVQIIGGTTDKVWDVVKTGHMEDGTLNRFMFICLPDAPDYRYNPDPVADVPKAFRDKLNAFFREGKRYDLLGYVPPGTGRKIELDAEVKAAILDLNYLAWQKQQMPYGGLFARWVQNTIKVAGILAVAENKYLVTMQQFDQAKRFVRWALANTLNKCAGHMADSRFERDEKRLLAKLKESDGRMTTRDAYRFLHIPKRSMDELLSTMMACGTINTFEETTPAGRVVEWIVLCGE